MKVNRDVGVGVLELVAVVVGAVLAATGHNYPPLDALLAGLGVTGVHHVNRGLRKGA